ncbi:MAG: hypothetical protein LC799_29065, partial [Actinobacteria bacterium]|nr:hypothetical protein [Actinomycetota bacterium]
MSFAQRFFGLARRAGDDGHGAGHVGQITSNAFMKREFGTKLITEFFPTVTLTHIIDTSGAYIPGHGTPTVILIGECRRAAPDAPVRAVLGIRGEPSEPAEPAKGLVWTDIANHVNEPGHESEWITVTDVARSRFSSHPWSLSGGGADVLLRHLHMVANSLLEHHVASMGFGAITGADEAFEAPTHVLNRAGITVTRLFGKGESTRDWLCQPETLLPWPYGANLKVMNSASTATLIRWLWPSRLVLRIRKRFGIPVQEIGGLAWWEYREFYGSRFITPLS